MSDYYIDARRVTLSAEGAELCARLIWNMIKDDSFDAVGGPTLGADPLVGAIAFLSMQAHEYWLAYTIKGLKLSSGIYGTTFFMLTGFHAMHVTVGTIMLITILYRMTQGDFNKHNHFGFEAVSWYWHFVDVVWLALFILVYWM